MLVSQQFYVRWDTFIYSSGVGIEPKGRQGIRFTLQLQAGLSLMVLVEVGIANGKEKVMRIIAHALGYHVKKRIRGHIKGQPQEDIGTSLVHPE
jgi:hypothetical protein